MTSQQARATYEALPDKLRIVALLKGKGFTAGEIADLVCRAESTVKGQLNSAFKRLGINSTRELTALLVNAGAIIPDEEAA